MFRQAKPSPYKIEGEGERFGLTKQKNIIVLVWFKVLLDLKGKLQNTHT